jgi:hypothetical protein
MFEAFGVDGRVDTRISEEGVPKVKTQELSKFRSPSTIHEFQGNMSAIDLSKPIESTSGEPVDVSSILAVDQERRSATFKKKKNSIPILANPGVQGGRTNAYHRTVN